MFERLTIFKEFRFEASHVLPKHPGQCARLHGHSWKLVVGVSGPVNPETGFVVDYGELSELVKAHIINNVDHQHLGQGAVWLGYQDREQFQSNPSVLACAQACLGPDFYPSSENLVKAFVRLLEPLVPELASQACLEEVSLDETCTSKATWRRNAS